MAMNSAAVIGGGMAGLVAARTLAERGVEVTLFESRSRLGGQVRTVDFMGHRVDVGAEALHAAGPHVGQLIDEVGLGTKVILANPGSTRILTPKGLRPLPTGVGPAGPTRLRPVIGSRILSPLGMARAALEPVIPRGDRSADTGVGTFISRRFGRQVTERLIDPLLGNLHAGDVFRLSLHAATPHVAAQASKHRSLLLAHRTRRAGGSPSFISFPDGLGELVDALVHHVDITIRTATTVTALSSTSDGWTVTLSDMTTMDFGAVVIATPAHVASELIRPLSPHAATGIGRLRSASVATVLAAYPASVKQNSPVLQTTGLLLPSGTGRLLKAATFLTNKWPQLADSDHLLVRLSAGRVGTDEIDHLDDVDLATRLNAELGALAGIDLEAVQIDVERWPRSIAQFEIGHLDRLANIRSELTSLPGIVVAGAPYEGIGIASCIRSGRQAAAAVAAPDE